MARLNVAAAGNADENINLINARFQAEALRRLRGHDVGVLDNSFFTDGNPKGLNRTENPDFMWKLTASNILDIAIGRGMATAYGYDLQSEETVHLRATAPSAGIKYLFVYLEWNFGNPVEAVGKIDIYDNGSSSSWTPSRQDNLIANPIGTYQMPLYRLAINTTGVITDRINWTRLGVKTIGNPLLAENARHSELASDTESLAGEAISLSGNALRAGNDKVVLRRKQIFSGSWILYNTVSKEESITLSEALSDGDLIMVEYAAHYYEGGSHESQILFRKVGNLNGITSYKGFSIASVFGGLTAQSGFTATQDTFMVNGKTLTYKGGYYLLNFANSGGTTLENNTIEIRAIYKCYI